MATIAEERSSADDFDLELEGRRALVTGGTKGIGAASAIGLAREGADIAIIGRHDDADARMTKQSVEALGRRCEIIAADCGKPEDAKRCVQETAAKLGDVDVLVHAAGGPVNGGLFEITSEMWSAAFDVHVHAIFHLCRAAIPLMQKKGSPTSHRIIATEEEESRFQLPAVVHLPPVFSTVTISISTTHRLASLMRT